MTDQFDFSIEWWEKFCSSIERLDMHNRHIPWDDPDIKKHGIIHLVERQELEKELTAIRDRYANTFDDLIAEHDPDLQKIDRHVENINNLGTTIYAFDPNNSVVGFKITKRN